MKTTGLDRVGLIVNSERLLTQPQATQFADLVHRRRRGEPIAYLIGRREFWSLNLEVTPDVLIPRPATETLVDWVLGRIDPGATTRILDLGSGSGNISLAIARARPNCNIVGIDSSPASIEVARSNSRRLNINNAQFLQGNWFEPLRSTTRFEIIVSNPPYIAELDPHLSCGDVTYEPRSALVSGADGLDDLGYIIAQASDYLVKGGALAVEHGYNQGSAVRALFDSGNFTTITTLLDLDGNERVTWGIG